jgi:hypothetical protein
VASRLFELVVLAAFPVGIFILMGFLELPSFVDPCHTWNEGGAASPTAAPAGPCIGRTSTNESRASAATRLVFLQGTALTGVLVGLIGAHQGRRWLVWTGVGLLALIGVALLPKVSAVFPLASAALGAVALIVTRTPGPKKA